MQGSPQGSREAPCSRGADERSQFVGFMDKLRNRFMMSKGHAKQDLGQATNDPYLQAEGQGERVRGGARQVGEQVKDASKNVRDAFKQ